MVYSHLWMARRTIIKLINRYNLTLVQQSAIIQQQLYYSGFYNQPATCLKSF